MRRVDRVHKQIKGQKYLIDKVIVFHQYGKKGQVYGRSLTETGPWKENKKTKRSSISQKPSRLVWKHVLNHYIPLEPFSAADSYYSHYDFGFTFVDF